MTQAEYNALFDKLYADWNNKPLKVLPSSIQANHGQCFDLAAEWAHRLGVPNALGNPSAFPYQNAHQIYDDFGPFQAQYFDRIQNTITAIPKKGDIIVWSSKLNGGAGHVAVAAEENYQDYFISFDENWDPSNWYPKHIEHLYEIGPVLGWLRFKNITSSPQPMPDNITRKSGFFDLWWQAYYGTQVDTDKVTDAQAKDRREQSIRERNRAGNYDLVTKFLFGDNTDSNKVTAQQMIEKIKSQSGSAAELKQKILDLLKNY